MSEEIVDEENYIELQCEECGGEGRTMTMRCYGGMPMEEYDDCEECYGNGTIEILESDYIIMKLSGSR